MESFNFSSGPFIPAKWDTPYGRRRSSYDYEVPFCGGRGYVKRELVDLLRVLLDTPYVRRKVVHTYEYEVESGVSRAQGVAP